MSRSTIFTITIGDKVWTGGQKTMKTLIDTARGALKGKNAIVALRKGNKVEMRKDKFPTIADLDKQVADYKAKGFMVYVVKEDFK